jgi:hypothetical protein
LPSLFRSTEYFGIDGLKCNVTANFDFFFPVYMLASRKREEEKEAVIERVSSAVVHTFSVDEIAG